ncbi:MAG: cupin domain-containing protein [Lentimicrobium sp.]|jgi:cupin 2 domain-containing protein|nr:cupin domain-containing protein [Lentimicrobium sp.]
MKGKDRGTTGNLFDLNGIDPDASEWFETLASGENLIIERIVSHGQTTPGNQWYDQELDEWVILLQGEASLEFQDGEVLGLQKGDYTFIPAHKKHRVTFTSTAPPCVWLAIHASNLRSQ